MSHTFESIKNQLQKDISASNSKTGANDTNIHDAMTRLMAGFGNQSGGDITLQAKTVNPSTLEKTYSPDAGYYGLSSVKVNAVTSSIDSNIKATNIKKGVSILGVSGSVEEGITPSGTKTITTNGTHDVTNYASAYVNVSSGENTNTPVLQTKSVTPSETTQTVTPDSGYDGLSSVSVGAISKTYVGSSVTRKSATTYTPSTNNQTIASGTYLSGTQTIKGDANLVPQNIQNGITIFGVTGTHGNSASGNFFMTEVTLASDHSTREWKTLCIIPFLGENLYNDKLFVMLFRKDTTELTYSVPIVMGCNSAYLSSSYVLAVKRTSYGMSVSYKPDEVNGYQLSNPNGMDISRICVKDSTGVIQIYPEKSYSFVAGTYVLVYGLLT